MLHVENLSVTFNSLHGKVHAVRGINYSLADGEMVALVGESGCGKSVSAQALLRLLPSSAHIEGKILFEGEDLQTLSKKEMRTYRGKKIGMIFQDPMTSLNPTMRVGAQILESVRLYEGVSKEEGKKRVCELLHIVGIPDPEHRYGAYPHEFSGGMRQRVMIAIALSGRPKLLIADEPTTALDVTIQAQILELLKKLQQSLQMTILLITHDLGIVAGTCDRVLVMYAGKIVEKGSVDKIFYETSHPYTQGLLASIPHLETPPGQELKPIVGTPPSLLSLPKGCAFCPRCPKAMRICAEQEPHFEEESACWLQKI